MDIVYVAITGYLLAFSPCSTLRYSIGHGRIYELVYVGTLTAIEQAEKWTNKLILGKMRSSLVNTTEKTAFAVMVNHKQDGRMHFREIHYSIQIFPQISLGMRSNAPSIIYFIMSKEIKFLPHTPYQEQQFALYNVNLSNGTQWAVWYQYAESIRPWEISKKKPRTFQRYLKHIYNNKNHI